MDTFRLVDEDDPEQHKIHTELYTVPQRTVDAVAETRANGGRVIAVGTTSCRTLETCGTLQGLGEDSSKPLAPAEAIPISSSTRDTVLRSWTA